MHHPPRGGPARGWGEGAAKPATPRPDEDGADPLRDASRGERLQRVMAAAGVGSRRACEALVAEGAVTVNGRVVPSLPAWVDPRRDRIEVRGRSIGHRTAPVYLMLFKPRGVVCTNFDPEGRRRAIDLVKHPSGVRLFPVGRLDVDSSGLLILTNDGPFANLLAHPRYGIHKTYQVTIAGALDDEELRKLEAGIFLHDRRSGKGSKAAASRVVLVRRGRDRTRVDIELTEGRNRQLRRMLLEVGHRVKKLRRVKLGPIALKGLRPGQWRDLQPREIEMLRSAADLGSEKTVVHSPRRARKPRG